jgi:hypothetical protein
MRALAKRPEARFSSARALARAFEAGLEGRWSEGLSPQAPWLDQDTTLAGAQDETLRDFPPLAMLAPVPTREGVALPPRWPVAPALDSPLSRGSKPIWRRISLGVALAALSCLILVAVAWGGSALVAALTTASSHATATATAMSTPAVPSISVQGDAIYAMRAGDNSVLWSYSTDGNALPSPSVVDGVVYAATTDGHLYALQITDGSVIWSKQITGSSPSGSPAVADGVVYVATQDGHVYALKTSDGTQIWRRRIRVDSRVTGSPTVTADTVSIQTERGTVYTLRTSDGTPLTGPTPSPTSGDNG